MWKQRLAIKLWSGWATYPQVFIDGKLIGGFKDLEAKLSRNEIK
ncbi:MAG: glutaredoxin [Bacteriovoracaceae bacterium]